jgi:hypothetical protein
MIVSDASCVDEQSFDLRWLRLFIHYLFHPDSGTQLVFDYLTHLHVSNGFDSVLIIVVGHLTRMAHCLPCT